jgi:hypothetical protein
MRTNNSQNQMREKNAVNSVSFFKTSILKCSKSLLAFLFTAFFAGNLLAGDLTVNVTSSTGGSLTGAMFSVTRGPNHIGNYSAGSTVTLVDGGTYSIFAYYNNTSTKREVFVSTSGGETFNFSTTNVMFNFSGGYLNFRTSGSWSSFGKTGGVWDDRELFPRDFYGNMMTIQTGHLWNDVRSATIEVNYEGQQNFHRNINVLRVLADDNSAISGATARGGNGSSFSGWHVSGTTNAQGLLVDLRPYSANGTYSYEARVNNTTATAGSQATSSNSYFLFKTIKLTLKLETCNGTPLQGGKARYGNGSSFGTWFFPTPNNTDVNGITSAQFFPGTYSIEMGYQTSTEVKSSVSIPNSNTTLTWKTTLLTLNWPGAIAYGGNGDSRFFNKPSMELLPGTLRFNFRGNGNNYQSIVIGGCSQTLSYLRVINESNEPIEGVTFTNYRGGQWRTGELPGSTSSLGTLLVEIPSGTTHVRASYLYSGTQKTVTDLATDNYTFTAEKVKLLFKDYQGNSITNENGVVVRGSSGYTTLGNYNGSGEFFTSSFSGNASFQTYYNNTMQQKNLTINAGSGIQEILFQTGRVYSSCGFNSVYTGAWRTFTGDEEYMPGNYHFSGGGNTQQVFSVVAGETSYICGGTPNQENDNMDQSTMNQNEMSVFPNPAFNTLNIIVPAEFNSQVSISILDLVTGKSVYSFKGVGSISQTIDVSGFNSGVYYVQINKDGALSNHKLIVQ